MSTKELIKAEIEKLDEEKLEELYDAIKKLTASNKPASEKPSFMAKLKRVKIDAPEDFSVNLDQYTSGEKRIE